MTQFAAQSGFLLLIIALAFVFGFHNAVAGDVKTAHLSQGLNVIWISIAFYVGWKLLPSVGAKNKVPEGRSLVTAGFVQNFRTIRTAYEHYNRGLFRFLLAVVFAEAGVNAFTVSVGLFMLAKSTGES